MNRAARTFFLFLAATLAADTHSQVILRVDCDRLTGPGVADDDPGPYDGLSWVPVLIRSSDLDGSGSGVEDDLVILVEAGSARDGDPATHGVRLSASAVPCPADVNGDGLVSPTDFNAWVLNYNSGCK